MLAFSPFRAVGNICGDVPISHTALYDAPVLMVAVGRSFLLYRGKELSLLRGGPTFESPVSAVAQTGRFRFVGEGGNVHCFSHHKAMWVVSHASVTKARVELIIAQDDLVFSYGNDKIIVVRQIKTGEMLAEIAVEGSEAVTSMILLEGYTNKLLVSTASGSLQLYNFKSGKLLFKAKVEPYGRVTCLAGSQYRDIVAFGTSTGRLVLYNISLDEEVCSFKHEGVAVTAVAFRKDKDGFLLSGTSAGEIAVWDLTNRCLDGVLTRSKQVKSRYDAFETPHTEPVHSLHFLHNAQGVLVSGSGDNALMQFRFDTVDGLGLLVRERRGHMGGCTAAQFYNTDLLVTAGEDQALRVTHVFSDRASWELSQGKLGRRGRDQMVGREALKLPPATQLQTCTTRNYQWASIVSLHEASAVMCSWRMDTRAMEHKLSGISTGMHSARSVALSNCGNYAVVGYSSGNVTSINLQNKSIKQYFLSNKAPSEHKAAHQKSVESVQVACGNTVVVSAGLDKCIMLWDLQNVKHLKTIKVSEAVSMGCLHEPSSIFISVQHFTLRAYNIHPDAENAEKPVRTFEGHQGPITAIALTPDTNRYVVSASADCVVMVSDLAAGVCVGYYRVASPITSLSFHPDALFMVTTHLGERGAFMWTNNLRYGFVPDVVLSPLEEVVEELPLLHYPVNRSESADEDTEAPLQDNEETRKLKGADGDDEREEEKDAVHSVELFDSSKDIALLRREADRAVEDRLNGIVCTGLRRSGLPKNVWYNITVIDQIKEKNQPLLPPKKKDVPFFLPTTSELRPTFIVQLQQQQEKSSSSTKFTKEVGRLSPFHQCIIDEAFDAALSILLPLSAQEMDLELRMMIEYDEEVEYTLAELELIKASMINLLRFLRVQLASRTNVDLVQGLIAAVLRSHGALFGRFGAEVVEEMESLAVEQNSARKSVDHLVGYPNCLLGTFTGSVV